MATIRAAVDADLPAVASYCAARMDGNQPPERFRRFFDYRWAERPNLGFMIDDGGKVGGFIGAIYSVRTIRGEEHRLCNINSWAVDPEHRKLSLLMAKKLLDQRGFTFTCFSPSEVVAECLRFFKFETSPTDKVLFTPAHGLSRRLRGRVRVHTPAHGVTEFEALLDHAQKRIFRDHAPYRCGQLLIEAGDRRSYVVTVRRGRGAKVFADVLHASDPALFVEAIGHTHLPLWRAHGTVLTGIDRRLLREVSRTSYVYRGFRPLQFRSPTLGLRDIDALYTEIVTICG